MKKFYISFLAIGFMSLLACGPSAEEQAKQEAEAKEKMDSLFNAAGQNMADTTAMSTADTAAAH